MGLKDTGTFEKRCKRYNVPGHGHELTFSCFGRLPLLKNPTFCDYLAEAVRAAQHTHRFDVWAYVFMPEHLHLLIYPTQEVYSISAILKSIKQSVSRRAINWLRQRGYDRNIFTHAAATNSVRYIHANPVRRGLVQWPQEWYYSSYRQMHGQGDGPLDINLNHFPKR
jgi:putative transposase